MSWAGKKSLRDSFRSLFRKKEQAPSFSVQEAQARRLEALLKRWVDGKGYRLPDRSIELSAARIGTDSLTLQRYFRARGEDFRTWRSRLRVQDAARALLAEPDASASLIGKRMGFSDRSNFTRQFKAIMGYTPKEWRNSKKNL